MALLVKRPIDWEYNNMYMISNYGYMNEWLDLQQAGHVRPKTTTKPQLVRRIPRCVQNGKDDASREEEEPSSFVQPINTDKYLKMYRDMSDQIALRYPNPGLPTSRTGAKGASWRHVRQVTQHGGTPILYLDGLVSHYDSDNVTAKLARRGEMRTHVRSPLYCPNKHDLSRSETLGFSWINGTYDSTNAQSNTQTSAALEMINKSSMVGSVLIELIC